MNKQTDVAGTDWFVYIIETNSGTLYTGITTDVERRFNEHVTGKGAKYLRGKGPLTLRLSYACCDRSVASQLECKVKQLSRSEKLALIQAPDRLSSLL